MSATPAPSLARRPSSRGWARIAAGALACALAPLVPLLANVPRSSWLISVGPQTAVVLGLLTLWATRRSRDRRPRLLAGVALAVVAVEVLLFVAWGLALLYGS